MHTQYCPIHQAELEVTSTRTAGKADPYVIEHLSCHHEVIAFSGSIEDIYVVGGVL